MAHSSVDGLSSHQGNRLWHGAEGTHEGYWEGMEVGMGWGWGCLAPGGGCVDMVILECGMKQGADMVTWEGRCSPGWEQCGQSTEVKQKAVHAKNFLPVWRKR